MPLFFFIVSKVYERKFAVGIIWYTGVTSMGKVFLYFVSIRFDSKV